MTLDKPITKSGLYGAMQEQLKKVNLAKRDTDVCRAWYFADEPTRLDAELRLQAAKDKALSLAFQYCGMREE